jgi:hypothetical protein
MSGDVACGPGEDWMGVEDAVLGFAEFLRGVKGCSVGTVDCYARHVRPFLSVVVGPAGVVDLRAVSASQVRSYVTELGGRYAADSLKLAATSSRKSTAWRSPARSATPCRVTTPPSGLRTGPLFPAGHPQLSEPTGLAAER